MVLIGVRRSPEEVAVAAAQTIYPHTRLAICLQKAGGHKHLRYVRSSLASAFRCLLLQDGTQRQSTSSAKALSTRKLLRIQAEQHVLILLPSHLVLQYMCVTQRARAGGRSRKLCWPSVRCTHGPMTAAVMCEGNREAYTHQTQCNRAIQSAAILGRADLMEERRHGVSFDEIRLYIEQKVTVANNRCPGWPWGGFGTGLR